MTATCCSCLKNQAHLECCTCNQAVCKKCAQFVTTESFPYVDAIPKDLATGTYCVNCYESCASEFIQEYEATMETAREVHIFFRGQGQERRALFLKKREAPLKVENCVDEEAVIMKLAYMAAKNDFNALIETVVDSVKIHDGSYTLLKWHGSAIPCKGEPSRLNRVIDPKFQMNSPSRR